MQSDFIKLSQLVSNSIWKPCHIDLTLLNENISYNLYIYILADTITMCLAAEASQRFLYAFRQNTRKTYTTMYQDFLSILVFLGFLLHQVNSSKLLSYMEYMAQNGYAHTNIANNMVVVKSMSLVYSQYTSHLSDDRISLFVKSIRNNAQLSPPVISLIDTEVLSSVPQAIMAFPYIVVYQSVYLFCFFFLSSDFPIFYPTLLLLLTWPGICPEAM